MTLADDNVIVPMLKCRKGTLFLVVSTPRYFMYALKKSHVRNRDLIFPTYVLDTACQIIRHAYKYI